MSDLEDLMNEDGLSGITNEEEAIVISDDDDGIQEGYGITNEAIVISDDDDGTIVVDDDDATINQQGNAKGVKVGKIQQEGPTKFASFWDSEGNALGVQQ